MRLSLAEQAAAHFKLRGVIPNFGQSTNRVDVGDIHLFPDGSAAMHWDDDGTVSVAGVIEEDE